MEILNPEIEEGNVEYKRYLTNLDENRLEQLSTQMKWRLTEGDNQAVYYLGVNDNGSIYAMTKNEKEETFYNFNLLVEKNNAEIISSIGMKYLDIDRVLTYFKVTIRKKKKIYQEIRVLLLGDTQTGKTTFLSNIILGKTLLNNSDPRIYLMNHKHELQTKKTSSINCNYIIHNDIKYAFIEAPGFCEYNRTKYKLLLSTNPDIIMLFTNKGGLINLFDKFICDKLLKPIITVNIFDSDSIYNCKKLINKENLFEQIYKSLIPIAYNKDKVKFNILNVYPHNDLGTVVSGFLVSGILKVDQHLDWNYRDENIRCKVQTIHINSEPVKEIETFQMLTLCLKPDNPINKNWKHGILSTIGFNKPCKKEIKFKFEKISGELSGCIYGFCTNKIVHVYNINKMNGYYTGIIENYIQDENTILIDIDQIKGIIQIQI